jgi:hypothetical protein
MRKLRNLEHGYLSRRSYIPVRLATRADLIIALNHNA